MSTRTSQSGFSLIELMVAMVCTLLVSGAIYGLLSSGQGAFRREPEVTDMQQNLRLAMDTIARDVATAGTGLAGDPTHPVTTFVQIFAQNLDNKDLPRPTDATTRTDELSMMISDSPCGAEAVCGYQNGHASHIRTVNATTCVATNSVPIILMDDGTWTVRYVDNVGGNSGGPGSCDQSTHADISVNAGQDPTGLNMPSGICVPNGYGSATLSCNPVDVLNADVITYRIALGTDGVPNLERGSTAALISGGTGFQALARGIEDLQVEYATAANPTVFVAGAPQVVNNNYSTLITQVRITLSGRTTNQRNLAGETADVSGNRFIRSTITSTVAVRTTLLAVSRQYAIQSPAPSPMPSPLWN